MKILAIAVLSVFVMFGFSYRPTTELYWETNFELAVKDAKKSDKKLLVNFTGSDWCGWCKKLDADVFSKPEFAEYAKENLVLVKLDFPKRKQLPQAEQEQNLKLARKYKVKGFPAILIMDADENVILETGYQYGGVNKYIEHLEAAIQESKKN
ncbi:MAG: thioredoxin family protein [Microscillaceae bacterium]|jgi:protein disulfide-isomerase|nr:thioredoxin family protein [Microscillaceae bacterium]